GRPAAGRAGGGAEARARPGLRRRIAATVPCGGDPPTPGRDGYVGRVRRVTLADVAPQPFRWEDGDRVIRFGRGALASVPDEVGDDYVLLTTPRGRERAPALAESAAAVHDVPTGRVDEVAAGLRPRVEGDALL